MKMHDCRRLTGPNLVWDRAGAVVDAHFDAAQADAVIGTWQALCMEMLKAVGWEEHRTCVHRFAYGASLALSAPVDGLYAATDIAEWAWQATVAALAGGEVEDRVAATLRLREAIAREANPAWVALDAAARTHDVTILSDDDEVSLGTGPAARTWPTAALPDAAQIDWSAYSSVPVGLVTGTNGKTTSVRACAAIARAAGLTPGLSSTDWISVGDEIVERGDYAGPGGARAVLRNPRVELALLETARGGLLRRGLGVTQADAALITNVSEDHLGDFGSRSVEELLEVKWTVARAVCARGTLVLCADDQRLVARARNYSGRLAWFSLRPDHPLVQRAELAATVVDGVAGLWRDAKWTPLTAVAKIPVTLNGIARHNVANALGAAALCAALGLPDAAIARGLENLGDADNPGRCNLFDVDGVQVLVDFAHNLEGMQALFHIAAALPARRRALIFSQAGDRPDEDIEALGRAAWKIGLSHAFSVELAQYARGRERGEVAALLRRGLQEAGADGARISHYETDTEALDAALDWARPGDLIITLALGEQSAVLARLTR